MFIFLAEIFIEEAKDYDKLELVVGCKKNDLTRCLNLIDVET